MLAKSLRRGISAHPLSFFPKSFFKSVAAQIPQITITAEQTSVMGFSTLRSRRSTTVNRIAHAV